MAGSVNKVILVGNLGRDPEIRTMQSGGRIANLSVATAESWKDRTTGERKERTEWHKVVVYNDGLTGVVERYLRKGSKIYLEGQLETRKWQDKDGQDRYTTEIVLRNFNSTLVMLDAKGGEGGGFASSSQRTNDMDHAPAQQRDSYASSPAPVDELEDEIPF